VVVVVTALLTLSGAVANHLGFVALHALF